jgi:hypothetical protein
MIDNKTRAPLFTQAVEDATASMLTHAENGCLSDPEGVTLYFKIRDDGDGLPIFKCIRGTGSVENLHQKLVIQLGQWNIGPHLASILLLEKFTRHNIKTGGRLRQDSLQSGHYEQYLNEQISEITKRLFQRDLFAGFVSTSDLASTGERFGISSLYHKLGKIFFSCLVIQDSVRHS